MMMNYHTALESDITPSYIVLYFNQSKILIAGNVLSIIDKELVGPNPEHTPDMDLAFESLKKLTQY